MGIMAGMKARMHEHDRLEVRAGKTLLALGVGTTLWRRMRHRARGLMPLALIAGGGYALMAGMHDRRAHRRAHHAA